MEVEAPMVVVTVAAMVGEGKAAVRGGGMEVVETAEAMAVEMAAAD